MNERPTAGAHRVVGEVVGKGELVVDATVGNGHDTHFLAKLVGTRGRVVGFDVQSAAIESTRKRVDEGGVGEWVDLFEESHAGMASRVDEAGAVMFNLGYLPGGDHEVITQKGETLEAIRMAVGILRPGGVVTVVCYPGHAGGDEEAAEVVELVKGLEGVRIEVGEAARKGAPFLVVVRA